MQVGVTPNAPKPKGIGFTMRAIIYSDCAGEFTTRRSRTGFIIFLISAPIYWFLKRQTSVETNSFGSEFIAMKQCCEYVRGMRYKLCVIGITIDFPNYILGDNQSVLCNTSKPHLILKYKSSSMALQFVCEGTSEDEWQTTYINRHSNTADILTKSLVGGEKRSNFIGYVLHYIDWHTWLQWIAFNCRTTVTRQWLDCWKFSWWKWITFNCRTNVTNQWLDC